MLSVTDSDPSNRSTKKKTARRVVRKALKRASSSKNLKLMGNASGVT